MKLLLTFFDLLLGCVVVMYLFYSQRRYRGFPVFSFMAFYTLLFNLLMTGALISKYISINLPPLLPFTQHIVYKQFSQSLFIIVLGGMAFLQLRIAVVFKGKPLRPFVRYIASIVFLAALTGLAVGSVMLFQNMPGADIILESTGDLLFFCEFLTLALLLATSIKHRDRRTRRLIILYSLMALCRYPLIFLMLVIPENIRFYSSIAVLFYINSLPLLWKVSAFDSGTLIERESGKIDFPEIVTEREKEIIHLVLAGKSNREIEEILCISPHTVKNHLYNIYRKTKVKNRYGLMVKYSTSQY